MKTITIKPFLELPLDQQYHIQKQVLKVCEKFYLDDNSVDLSKRKTQLQLKVCRKTIDHCIRGTPLFEEFNDRNRLKRRIQAASFCTIHQVYNALQD